MFPPATAPAARPPRRHLERLRIPESSWHRHSAHRSRASRRATRRQLGRPRQRQVWPAPERGGLVHSSRCTRALHSTACAHATRRLHAQKPLRRQASSGLRSSTSSCFACSTPDSGSMLTGRPGRGPRKAVGGVGQFLRGIHLLNRRRDAGPQCDFPAGATGHRGAEIARTGATVRSSVTRSCHLSAARWRLQSAAVAW